MDKFQIKKQIKRLLSEEYNMGGFADGSAKSQQSTLGSNGDSTMNTPTIKEDQYIDNVSTLVAKSKSGYALKYVFDLTKNNKIDYSKFQQLIRIITEYN